MGRDYWSTWSGTVGGGEDGVIAEMGGKKCVNIVTANDQILKLGGKTSGVWSISLKIYVPTGTYGYFNVLANFNGASSNWAPQVYFGAKGEGGNPLTPGVGTIHAAVGNALGASGFTFNHDEWTDVKIIADLDENFGYFYVNNDSLLKWVWTEGSFGGTQTCPKKIDALDFYGPEPPSPASEFYITDVVFKDLATFPIMGVTPTEISKTIVIGDEEIIKEPITVANTGTYEGEYAAEVVCEKGWLTLEGDIEGEVEKADNKTFDAVIDTKDLEVGEYEAVIKVATDDTENPLFEIPCTLTIQVGINSYNISTVIFPNPASDFVNVSCNTLIKGIQVINSYGQIVYNTTVNNNHTTIDTSNLSAGYYFIKLDTTEGSHSVKLIVK
jgi:hypothetical protein